MTDPADDDEYLVEYDHGNRKLRRVYDTEDDNRAAAMDSAARTGRSEGVKNLRVYRRPRSEWERVV